MNFKKAINIYKKFHFMTRKPSWGAIPFSCSCAVCFPNCVCEDTILFTALFDPEVRVPGKWVTATISRRSEQKPIGVRPGASGAGCRMSVRATRRQSIPRSSPQEEEPAPAPAPPAATDFVLPEPGMPSSSEDDFQVHTHLASDRMPD